MIGSSKVPTEVRLDNGMDLGVEKCKSNGSEHHDRVREELFDCRRRCDVRYLEKCRQRPVERREVLLCFWRAFIDGRTERTKVGASKRPPTTCDIVRKQEEEEPA